MLGNCPKCGKPVNRVNESKAEVNVGVAALYRRHVLAYTCPSCQTILGCQLDPDFVRVDIVNDVVKRLGGK